MYYGVVKVLDTVIYSDDCAELFTFIFRGASIIIYYYVFLFSIRKKF